jgi:hypothetical protein
MMAQKRVSNVRGVGFSAFFHTKKGKERTPLMARFSLQLFIRARNVSLPPTDLSLFVETRGICARFTLTATFRNDVPKDEEGELLFSLPEGTSGEHITTNMQCKKTHCCQFFFFFFLFKLGISVCGFGFDVNGEIVEAIIGPRTKAQQVFEKNVMRELKIKKFAHT